MARRDDASSRVPLAAAILRRSSFRRGPLSRSSLRSGSLRSGRLLLGSFVHRQLEVGVVQRVQQLLQAGGVSVVGYLGHLPGQVHPHGRHPRHRLKVAGHIGNALLAVHGAHTEQHPVLPRLPFAYLEVGVVQRVQQLRHIGHRAVKVHRRRLRLQIHLASQHAGEFLKVLGHVGDALLAVHGVHLEYHAAQLLRMHLGSVFFRHDSSSPAKRAAP